MDIEPEKLSIDTKHADFMSFHAAGIDVFAFFGIFISK